MVFRKRFLKIFCFVETDWKSPKFRALLFQKALNLMNSTDTIGVLKPILSFLGAILNTNSTDTIGVLKLIF